MPEKPLQFKVTESGCHEPTSHRSDDGKGYPIYYHRGKKSRIYRDLFELRYGPVPAGLLVRHTCDNRKCINTDHMLLGTRADNMYDKTARGRTGKGEKNGRSILIEEDVRFILRSSQTSVKLARKFRVNQSTISAIRTGKRWKHLQNLT